MALALHDVLVAPMPFAEFESGAWKTYVNSMYEVRTRGRTRPTAPAKGLSVSRTKRGALSIRRTRTRSFCYVTYAEITELAAAVPCSQADLWQAFKAKDYIIKQTRMECERIYADLKAMPF